MQIIRANSAYLYEIVSDFNLNLLFSLACILKNEPQAFEGGKGVDQPAFDLVLAHEQASFGVLIGVSRMDEHAFELRYSEQSGHTCFAELVVRLLAVLGRDHVERHLVRSFRDSGLSFDFALLLQVAHGVFEGVAEELPVDEEPSDGVFRLLPVTCN